MNKYPQNAEHIIDLHGYTTFQVKNLLDDFFAENKYKHVRLITGKGNHGQHGPVLKNYTKGYLQSRNIRFAQSKLQDGGEGALEVYPN